MTDDEALAAMALLLVADPGVANRTQLNEFLGMASRLRGVVDRFEMRCTRRINELAEAGRSEPPASMLGKQGKRSTKTSKKIEERSKVGEQMPGFEDALDDGDVSAEHLDALASATKGLAEDAAEEFHTHESELLEAARHESVEAFARRCRDLAKRLMAKRATSDADELDQQRKASKMKRWTDRISGMKITLLELDPLRDAELHAGIDAHIARLRGSNDQGAMSWSELQAQAVVDAVSAGIDWIDDDEPGAAGASPAPGTDARPTGAGEAVPPDGADSWDCDDPSDGWPDGVDDPERADSSDGRPDGVDDPDRADPSHGPERPIGTGSPSAIAQQIGGQLADRIAARQPSQGLVPGSAVRRARRPNRAERVPEVMVLVGLDVLVRGAEATDGVTGVCETVDGQPLPVSTVRRLCCDAEIVPAVLSGEGEVTDLGRSRRTANRAQRRQLAAMHRGCAHPDCSVSFSACRIHHVKWWWRDLGATDIANLLPLCERHHHLVHEGGWGLTLDAGRIATWTRPDGTIWRTGPTIDRPPARQPATTGRPAA